MLPVFNENCTALIADVVFPYPPINNWWEYTLSPYAFVVAKKCFTNVVLLGSNKCKVPEQLSSALDAFIAPDILCEPVPCAKSYPVK